MNCLNQLGMVLLNGVREKAKFTSMQKLANTVIDFIWIQIGDVDNVLQFHVVEDDRCRWYDHRMVTVTFKGAGDSLTSDTRPSTDHREQVRWNLKGVNSWCKLQEVGNRLMMDWYPRLEGKFTDQKGAAEEAWSQWLSAMRRMAELGLGYAIPNLCKREMWYEERETTRQRRSVH
jgi:hypothetical protein